MSSKRAWYADYTLQVRDPFAGLPADLVTLVKTELTEGEEILWMEQPEAGFLFRARFPYFFGCYTGGSAITLVPRLLFGKETIDWSWYALGGAGLLLGAVVVWLSVVVASRRSLYMITNHRLICFQTLLAPYHRAMSYYFQHQVKAEYIKLKKRGSGRANLMFSRGTSTDSAVGVGFFGIRRAEEVKQLLEQRLTQNLENPINDLPARLQPALKAHLTSGEKVLWTGLASPYWARKQPAKDGEIAVTGCMLAVLVGLVVAITGFVLGQLFAWFGVALLLSGIGIGVRAILKSSGEEGQAEKEALNTAYVITGRKLMKVVGNGPQEEQLSIFDFTRVKAPPLIRRINHTKNVADLHLMDSTAVSVPQTEFILLGISEPDKVERLINQLTVSGTL